MATDSVRTLTIAPQTHGGRLREASREYGIALSEWLDLSTGINPLAYPVQAPPLEIWQRLPEPDDGLELAAANYFWPGGKPTAAALLPVPGSQAAIQRIPALRCKLGAHPEEQRVVLVEPSYSEHRLAWQKAGFQCESAASIDDAQVARADVLVLVNPNNPTGKLYSPECLTHWRQQLAARGGWLIVDEAFADPVPEYSLVNQAGNEGLIILRSLGKFFGLAGARVGFVLGPHHWMSCLAQDIGPWAVAGPSRWVAQQALSDTAWQRQQTHRLHAASQRLAALLQQYHLPVSGGCSLFQWVVHPSVQRLHQHLAEQAILTRYFPTANGLRVGLPGNEAAWLKLDRALAGAPLIGH